MSTKGRDATGPPLFGRSVNPIPTIEGADFAHHITTGTLKFLHLNSDIPHVDISHVTYFNIVEFENYLLVLKYV